MDQFSRKENHKGNTHSNSNLILEHDTLLLVLDMQEKLIANIKGKNIYSLLKYESGVHRVQRVPDTETQGRVHTLSLIHI